MTAVSISQQTHTNDIGLSQFHFPPPLQYRFLEDELVPPFPVSAHALVTGIAVDEPFRRRGYGRALLLSVIASLPRRAELWVEVGDENEAAKGLYRSCGFVERWKQQSLCLRSVT